MSLINDALKRAQETQMPHRPVSGPELRPVEQDHASPRRVGIFLPASLVLLALAILFSLWQVSVWRAKSRTPSMQVRALAKPEVVPALAAPPPAVQEVKPAPPVPVAAAVPPPMTDAEVGPQGTEAISNASSVAIQPPEPPPLKLQSIVFSRRPTAMISGKIVEPGDKIRAYTVKEIRSQQVLLVADGQTIILTLK